LDLLFPHHENELAQTESATGEPFVRYWLHNGLTRLNTKKISRSDAVTPEGAAALAAVAARKLIAQYGPELLRYMLLSTHYRSPIEFSDEILASSRKGLAAFERLFERVERLTGKPMSEKTDDMDRSASSLLESPHAAFAKAVLGLKMKFLETMDDDFNTAGAIGVLHELANEINGFVERSEVERTKQPDLVAGAAAAAQTLRNLGTILGLFMRPTGNAQARADAEKGLVHQLVSLLIDLRKEARQSKNFALADRIRNGLTQIGITLEDRADGTGWRKS
jgi:cysteinyl-tRNA synthetase